MATPPQELFALVAVPVPLGRAFSYAVPANLAGAVSVGQRVLCEFGRRKLLGVIIELTEAEPAGVQRDKLKPLLAVFDQEPALPQELLTFLRELATYYLAPIGEVLRLALPALARSQVAEAQAQELFEGSNISTVGRMIQVAVALDGADPTGLKGRAREVWEHLKAPREAEVATLEQVVPGARAVVQRLVKQGLLKVELRPQQRDPFFAEPVARDEAKTLNSEQQVATDTIVLALRERRAATYLLDGITGSGKTEVYLHAVAECLASAGSAIVLVPEIALTPQLVSRFRARFGDRIAVLHSGLSETDRVNMWRRLRSSELRVAVGARSALFAPVQDLRLVCVDEEHDSSFKQEEGVRYHARDMALLRAHRANAVCVLGSATPSLASEALAKKQKLTRLVLPKRAHSKAVLPKVETVDLRSIGPGPSGNRLLSITLHRAIEATLAAGQQTILFLNRRGFAPSVVCDACGEVQRCPNCSVALTLHRSGRERLSCHYCDFNAQLPEHCSKCAAPALSQEGAGTERIESVLSTSFPEARIARLDRDVARGLHSEQVLTRMRRGEVDILVGTQMVTKGHDLPEVTLVGVLNADAALSMPDFQAAERTFQLLVQVAGRAGRAGKQGHVLIQTRVPDHPAVRCALSHNHRAFVEHELLQRREARYPPFVRLLLIKIDALSESVARDTASQLALAARRRLPDGVEVLGPTAAPLARLRNRFRYRVLLRSRERRPLYELAHMLGQVRSDSRARIHFDIDPVNML